MPTANDIRQQFIDFFVKKHGHTFVPSSPVVPIDDPTLMFTNAGMNQFKDVFLGAGSRPYQRAANTQKCIRASGKHNDLEDVGRDTYHHTFFEMLGNWSFGDYYKAEAIQWAWELLTEVWKIDKTRLHATVFGGEMASRGREPPEGLEADEEAEQLWTQVTDINPKHVHRFGRKDNFWMMGETGPCGPCSEIHIDRTPDGSGGALVNAGDPRVMEIWNLVFIQYNRDDAGKLHPLPARHVDTGMGFERVCAVLQKKDSNYDTDVFSPLLDAIGKLVGKKYGGQLEDLNDVAFRAIADHLRALTFAITDGARPDNKGRGSVLRSILRRAVRFGYQCFGQREPFIFKLVPTLVDHMGGAFPELKKQPQKVAEVIKGEEADFLKTIERGLGRFRAAATQALIAATEKKYGDKFAGVQGKAVDASTDQPGMRFLEFDARRISFEDTVSGFKRAVELHGPEATITARDVFNLHTTDGFPPDLTRQMAQEHGLQMDIDGYFDLMSEHEDKSRGKDVTAQAALKVSGSLPTTDDRPKWSGLAGEGTILGWIDNNQFISAGKLEKHKNVGLILDKTCFYAEAGGQVGDTGSIITPTGSFHVEQTTKVGNAVVHIGHMADGWLDVGHAATLAVAPERDFTRKNHTATHLLHWALHKVLGEHVEQRGSKVKPDEFTFDFSHTGPVTLEERAEVERLVNEKIYQDLQVTWRELSQDEARKLPGVKAFFGDKYGDVVRVVEIHETALTPSPPHPLTPGPSPPGGRGEEEVFSREFCGGTHLNHTGQAGFFKIVSEEAVGKGVRRLTCVTAREAVATVQRMDRILGTVASRINCKPEELPTRIEALQEEIKKLQQQLKKGTATDLVGTADKLLAAAIDAGGAKIIVGEMPAGPEEAMRSQVDRLRQKAGSSIIVFGWSDKGKVQLLAAVTDDLVKKGVHAGKLVGQVAKVVGGGGGGKPTLASAGGKEPAKLAEALDLARKLSEEILRG